MWIPEPGAGSLPAATTKGDIAVYDGTQWVIVAAGADDTVLTADAAESAGVKWAAGGGGGITQSTFTPTLEAATTDPTLGTGATAEGLKIVQGGMVHYYIHWLFGTSGVSAGSGRYFWTPVDTIDSTNWPNFTACGEGWGLDTSDGDRVNFACYWDSGNNQIIMPVTGNAAATANIDNDTPWTWAADDRLSIHVILPLAS